jgi:two-component sensor histidine kinase
MHKSRCCSGGQNEGETTNHDALCSSAQVLGNVLLLGSDCRRHVRTENRDHEMKWISEFRDGWRGRIEPSSASKMSFALVCLLVATLVRFGFSIIRSDVPFSPYYPAILFATIFGGVRTGVTTAAIGAALGFTLNFGTAVSNTAKASLVAIYAIVSLLTIWAAEHHRLTASHYRRLSKSLVKEEDYRKLVIEELEHRLKNKVASIHAVVHQVLRDQPDVWKRIDGRIRALSSADELIAKADQAGLDLRDLFVSELEPYGHVRYTLDGDPVYLPAKLAVNLALVFHELATNSAKYGAFSASSGLLHVSWKENNERLQIRWDETGGPIVGPIGTAGFGTRLLKSALMSFDGKAETNYLPTGIICSIECKIVKA